VGKKMDKKIKLGIAVLSGRDHNPRFVKSLLDLVMVLAVEQKITFCVMLRTNVGCLSAGRQLVMDQAIERGFTHLLYIDDDMTFLPTVAYDLLKHSVPVVALNAVRKDPSKQIFCARDMDGEPLSSINKSGLQEVTRCGMGVMLVDVQAVKDMPKPYFEVVYNRYRKAYISEDYFFCDHVRANGHAIFVDHDASQYVGHVGDFTYGINGD